jgi:acetyl esterase/lipase
MRENLWTTLAMIACVISSLASGAESASDPRVVPLWPAGSANNPRDAQPPLLEIFYPVVPARAQPVTMVILPGGGFAGLSPYERRFGEYFAALGYPTVVVSYRVAPHRHPASFADAARAIRLLRKHGTEWKLPVQRIALLGGSAGGHLAAMIATQPDLYRDPDDDLAASISARPDRLILLYPVITAIEPFAYASFERLLGPDATDELKARVSPERHVSPNTPATLLIHAADDPVVNVQNSVVFAEACWRAKVPAELHVYPRGGHGKQFAYDAEMSPLWRDVVQRWLARWMDEKIDGSARDATVPDPERSQASMPSSASYAGNHNDRMSASPRISP